ncbi:lipooligosaccharide transport system permease protein [Cryobacterium mesophilum]|uniref:Transport permease protein n=2 Tax=Terrimesophilobacter mesophilus TaxID=433647 RepID=A0A4R8VDP2_9MICO|nr:ABC transporter permease [Terrimesophilobacter mesophilus]MBB5633578.1 lipooligosaccharide transport system permease protein [Terrimesophilobacter mesophilus]TFB80280.1 ABC transporter permease [Terrimesophilobacter mesophilus]
MTHSSPLGPGSSPVTPVGTRIGTPEHAMAGGLKPRRFGGLYVAEHRLKVMRGYLQTMVATGIGTPLLYLYALGVGLATLVDANMANGGSGGSEVSYLIFVAPALLCSAAMTTATEEFSYPIMLGFKWNPTFFGMNAAPLQGGQIINGVTYAVIVRLVAQSIVYYLFMLLFGAIPGPFGWLVIVVGVLTGMSLGALLMAYATHLKEDKGQFNYIMRFGVIPLTLFSGTFFPLSTLPVWLHWIGWISPLWHGTELSRVLSYGYQEPAWLSVVHVAYLVLLIVVGWWLARRLAVKRLNR